ncbi:MAG: hypothetical protein A2283_12735 [Lentisphaerae bacterium RIFOXYA12_FULL_48_11]|nr:MAG: hypothetical protein A2283_12735 [Lentisphaerae bacterium RIFOXYA12_FULL_48_11]
MTACILTAMCEHEYIAVWLAAVGTLGAVVVSLWLAFRNSDQLATICRTLSIPHQITLHRAAAQRLEHNGDIFPKSRDSSDLWLVPSDSRALRRILKNLKETRDQITPLLVPSQSPTAAQQYNLNKVRNIHLLLPHIETLIKCHDELERMTGITTRDPDEVEPSSAGDATTRAPEK